MSRPIPWPCVRRSISAWRACWTCPAPSQAQRAEYGWMFSVPCKIKVEFIRRYSLSRMTRFELEQLEVVSSENAQALVKCAALMGSGHVQHCLCFSFATRYRLSAYRDETGVI